MRKTLSVRRSSAFELCLTDIASDFSTVADADKAFGFYVCDGDIHLSHPPGPASTSRTGEVGGAAMTSRRARRYDDEPDVSL